jgi:chromosome segregation ATPase
MEDFKDFEYKKKHFTLTEIAEEIRRPRTTLKDWYAQFREYIPTTGNGRTMKYRKEALDMFSIISKMKDMNEPNEAIRKQLGGIATEIIVYDDEEEEDQTYVGEVLEAYKAMAKHYGDLTHKYQDLSFEVSSMKEMLKEMNRNVMLLADKDESGMQELSEKVEEKFQGLADQVNENLGNLKTESEQLRQQVQNLPKEQQEFFEEQEKRWEERERTFATRFERIMQEREELKKKGFFSRFFG